MFFCVLWNRLSESRRSQIIFCPTRFASLSGLGRPDSSGSCERASAPGCICFLWAPSAMWSPPSFLLFFPTDGSCFSHLEWALWLLVSAQLCSAHTCILLHRLRNQEITISFYNIEIILYSLYGFLSASTCISFCLGDNPGVESTKQLCPLYGYKETDDLVAFV